MQLPPCSAWCYLALAAAVLACLIPATGLCQAGDPSPAAKAPAKTASAAAPTYPPTPPSERMVGMAYSTWHRSAHWHNVWGTPELGFYRSDNRAVIRQHAEWLADAGVNFIFVDWSNDIDYTPGVTKGRPDFDMIEGATKTIFEEYTKLKRHPKIAIMIGCPGAPQAVKDGRLTRKAGQVYQEFIANPRFRPLYQDYLGKPLLIVYVGTPSPWQSGVPDWSDPRFTVRFMTGFLTQQPDLLGPGRVSKYGYWSWEDRGAQTYTVYDGHPEAMTVVACWRGDPECPTPGRRGGQTFREEWARARKIGPRIVLDVSWNEWTTGEQPSAEVSKDIEPSKEFGDLYLRILKQEVALFKAGR